MHVSELLTITLTLRQVMVEVEQNLADVLMLTQLQDLPLSVPDHLNPKKVACRTIVNNPETFWTMSFSQRT